MGVYSEATYCNPIRIGPSMAFPYERRESQDRRVAGNAGALLKLEQEGYIASEWGVSDNNRRAKFYRLTRAGRGQLQNEAREWDRPTQIIARFFAKGAAS